MGVPELAVLITAGVQVPEIRFVDVVGSEGATAPWHKGAIALNVGLTGAESVTQVC